MKRFGGSVVAMLTLVSAVQAAELPQYVKGPISGLVFGCQEAKQKAPKPETYVTQGDLDGDGKPDFVVDVARGCAANRDLFCNAEGCSIDIYLSSESGQMGSFKVKTFSIGKQGAKPALIITKGGGACSKLPGGLCKETLVFNGEMFVTSP